MNPILMSQFYHGLVIQRGPWENQYTAQPSYIKPQSGVVGGASPTDLASRSGLIPNLDRTLNVDVTMSPTLSKSNMHVLLNQPTTAPPAVQNTL